MTKILQWKLSITRSLGPRKFALYIRYFVISVANKQYKTKEMNSLGPEKLAWSIRYFIISDLFTSSFHCNYKNHHTPNLHKYTKYFIHNYKCQHNHNLHKTLRRSRIENSRKTMSWGGKTWEVDLQALLVNWEPLIEISYCLNMYQRIEIRNKVNNLKDVAFLDTNKMKENKARTWKEESLQVV